MRRQLIDLAIPPPPLNTATAYTSTTKTMEHEARKYFKTWHLRRHMEHHAALNKYVGHTESEP